MSTEVLFQYFVSTEVFFKIEYNIGVRWRMTHRLSSIDDVGVSAPVRDEMVSDQCHLKDKFTHLIALV